MTEDYCSFEEVEREEKGERGGWTASFTHVVGRLCRTCWLKDSELTEEELSRYKRCFWEIALNVRDPFIPLVSNVVDLAWTKQNKGNHSQNNQTRWPFVSSGRIHAEAESCKELTQTGLRYSAAERENGEQQSREKERRENTFLHSTGEYEHMISHMLHSPPPLYTHTHGCGSAQKHCGVHPGPSQPNFPATPIQVPCPRRLSYKTPPTLGPSQSPSRSLKPTLPPCSPPPSSQLRSLPRALHWQAAWAAEWMDPGTGTVRERERETQVILYMK